MSMANFGDWTGLLIFTDHLAMICTDCILDFDPLHDFLMSFRRILRIRVDSASKQLVNLLLSGKERLSAVSTETRNWQKENLKKQTLFLVPFPIQSGESYIFTTPKHSSFDPWCCKRPRKHVQIHRLHPSPCARAVHNDVQLEWQHHQHPAHRLRPGKVTWCIVMRCDAMIESELWQVFQ